MERRDVLTGGFLSAFARPAAPAAAQNPDNRDIVQALDKLSDAVQRTNAVAPELTRIRDQQRTFLKANQKFPDYIEIGIGIWENVYDWHVRHQQPLVINRTVDGRYTMTVLQTTMLVLRPEQSDTYVGFAFDAR